MVEHSRLDGDWSKSRQGIGDSAADASLWGCSCQSEVLQFCVGEILLQPCMSLFLIVF